MRSCCRVALFVAMMMLAACAPKADNPAEAAARTAKLYYDALLEEKYDEFVAGLDQHLGPDAGYDAQLSANARMFLRQQKEAHQGIVAFEVAGVECDESVHAANVFLNVQFADSTKEQIVVPMIERDDVWLMR